MKGESLIGRETRTILVVDSSATTLFYLGMLLRRLEYKVVTTQSAEEALRIMDNAPPAILLTETSLPNMSGMSLLKRIKEDPRLTSIPVVMLTSTVDPELRDACLHMGCAAFLFKPVEPDDLYQKIQSASESAPRGHIRLATSLRVITGKGAATGGPTRPEYATAISEGGLFVRTSAPRPQDAVVPIRIFLPEKEIIAKAVVLYRVAASVGTPNEPGMGMKFAEIADADRERIRNFIKEQLTEDIAPQGNRDEQRMSDIR